MFSKHQFNGHKAVWGQEKPLILDSGFELFPVEIAYQTYGELNSQKNNAILICHALTGDQYVADDNPTTGKKGWWSEMVGSGLPIDTNKYFVICSNVLGGCMGTTGPKDINQQTGKAWGLDFPVITIGDMVNAQKRLIEHLGIDSLFCVIGGSMGGMQVLKWAEKYPEKIFSAVPIATSWRLSAQNIAFNEVGRQAIMADPEWSNGEYSLYDKKPARGLAVARMVAHITYLSETALQNKFGRNLQSGTKLTYGFSADFQVESYLRHQGQSFVNRFDANSYLYITKAMDYFDLTADAEKSLAEIFKDSKTNFCIISFSSDWLFPTSESKTVVNALTMAGAKVSFLEIESDKGHDAFLLYEPEFSSTLKGFINSMAVKRGI